ncbi:MAG: carbohydrate ABC transporter permease, partial [Rhodobacteraceae bacterium]|nr:carbohydrate ABC transporter permease [Paracoccaceae bacterium]
FNTLTVTIPATIIPILVAAFAAYALAWMDFPGRALLIAAVVGLLVVPLQLALIPLLQLHGLMAELAVVSLGVPDPADARRLAEVNWLGALLGFEANDTVPAKGYIGVWLAHTGFGLPLAIYLLRNYMVGLPRDIIENAKVDGATDFQIFTKIILPLSFPALASFAIFQFLRRDRRHHGDDQADRRASGHPRRQLGDPGHRRLRVDRGAAGRVLRDAALPGARPLGRLGEIGKCRTCCRSPKPRAGRSWHRIPTGGAAR